MNEQVKNRSNVCEPAVKYKLTKLGLWCRTHFTIEKDENGQLYFKQNNAFHRNRNADWKEWGKPNLRKEMNEVQG